jgi:hypothetical protein
VKDRKTGGRGFGVVVVTALAVIGLVVALTIATPDGASRTAEPETSAERAAGESGSEPGGDESTSGGAPGAEEASGEEGGYEEHTYRAEVHEAKARAGEHQAAVEAARADGTLGLIEPITSKPARGWAGEDLWSRHSDDWEPAVAADPSAPNIYMLATRYGGARACGKCPGVSIRLRISKDDGHSWSKAAFLCKCPNASGEYDPQIEVDRNGTVYAAFLRGYRPGVTFIKSSDHGKTWSKPVSFTSFGSRWSDKPSLAVSPDGQNVYLAYNGPSRGDSWMAQSHDSGHSWSSERIRTTNRYHFAGGGAASNSGVVAFGESDYNQHYTGNVNTLAVVSDDAGGTWRHIHVAQGRKQPDCTSRGCYDGFYGPTPAMTRDGQGDLVLAYARNLVRGGRQRLYVSRSTDDGQTWSRGERLSPTSADAIFPAIVGGKGGDIRLWWMDTRTGEWNTWYRTSRNGGSSWSKAIRISDATSGTAYKSARGFPEAYGDYGEIDITDRGRTFAAWGEAPSYYGPGGVWFNRTT